MNTLSAALNSQGSEVQRMDVAIERACFRDIFRQSSTGYGTSKASIEHLSEQLVTCKICSIVTWGQVKTVGFIQKVTFKDASMFILVYSIS